MISRSSGPILIVCSLALGTAPSQADEKPAPVPAAKKPAAPWKEVTVEYLPAPLPEGKIGTAEELKLILEAGADLKTERPIQYRRQVLPAGSYRVTIESSGGRNFFFVIAPAGAKADEESESDPEESGQAPGGAGRRPGMGVAGLGVGPRAAAAAGARDETGKKTGSGGARGKTPDEPAVEERPGKKETGGKEPDPKAREAGPGKIRALFRLVKNPRPSTGVEFGVRPIEGGKRFELSVQAGSTLGRANIGFADAEKR